MTHKIGFTERYGLPSEPQRFILHLPVNTMKGRLFAKTCCQHELNLQHTVG